VVNPQTNPRERESIAAKYFVAQLPTWILVSVASWAVPGAILVGAGR